ncbi:nuclear transport factor 2 family protein [Nonomuraea longispora]|uniref:Nuclear transport factor 2 family protein n=2 Tax=Nonomuraea longispora TaxID=1848320 RepID=A0A4V2XLN3_9ACTN|nr:nuclear transport factor 2 family protein [Nonomuraea longispora]
MEQCISAKRFITLSLVSCFSESTLLSSESVLTVEVVMPVARAESTSLRYREAGEAKDLDALIATLAPDVVFHSPLSARARFAGHRQMRELFGVALNVLGGLRYHTDVGDERTRMLASSAHLNGQELEESTLLRLNDEALIAEITMWIRPLPALTAVMAALGPGLAQAAGKPVLSALVGAAVKPLILMTRVGDRTLVPLLDKPSG